MSGAVARFIIEGNVELPKRKGGRKNGVVYPFAEMKVGDSFFAAGVSNSVQTAASNFQRLHPGKRFATRTVDRDAMYLTHGTRCWRTK